MAWIILVVSGIFETVWATALAESKGFTRLVPSLIFVFASVISVGGLGLALRTLPVGTGYAVWVGIGAVGTAGYGMVMMGDPVSAARILCLLLILAGVVGLRLVS